MSFEFFSPPESEHNYHYVDPFDSIRYECFAPPVMAPSDDDDPVREALAVLANATITRDGNTVQARLNERTEIRFTDQPFDAIRFEPNIRCTATCTDNRISITNISGIAIDPGPGAPWINIQQIEINGDRATVTVWPGVPFHFDLAPGSFNQIKTILQNAGILPNQ